MTFTALPQDLQVWQRDAGDSAAVPITGSVDSTGYDSIIVEIFRDDTLWYREADTLQKVDSTPVFSLAHRIAAGLWEYTFRVYIDTFPVAQVDSVLAGDIYLIEGQSNASADDYDNMVTYQSQWLRTFGTSQQDSAACAVDTVWCWAQGDTHYSHGSIGVWGVRLGETIIGKHNVPVAILNGAQGATGISLHLRNNSTPQDLNTIYGRFLYRIKFSGTADQAKALLWHQGENDYSTTVSEYIARFDSLYTAWQEDYPGLEKVYIFQIRQGCGGGPEVREAQRVLPFYYTDVEIMATNGLPDHDGCHFGYAGYNQMAEWIFRLMDRDLYGSSDTLDITPPDIKRIFYVTGAHAEIALEFDQAVVWPEDTLGYSLLDYFYLDTAYGVVDSAYVTGGSTVVLQLKAAGSAGVMTYLPAKYYNNTAAYYEGPWLRNTRGIGALSFYRFPISGYDLESQLGDLKVFPESTVIGLDTVLQLDAFAFLVNADSVDVTADATWGTDDAAALLDSGRYQPGSEDVFRVWAIMGGHADTATLLVSNAAVPVVLSSFSARRTDQAVILAWTTQSELGNLGWNILRKQGDENRFVKINPALIPGSGTTNLVHEYSFTDPGAPAVTCYYRLEQVDVNGRRDYSGEIGVSGAEQAGIHRPGNGHWQGRLISGGVSDAAFSIRYNGRGIFTLKGEPVNTGFTGSGIYLLRGRDGAKIKKILILDMIRGD